jgi:hypothetical protein
LEIEMPTVQEENAIMRTAIQALRAQPDTVTSHATADATVGRSTNPKLEFVIGRLNEIVATEGEFADNLVDLAKAALPYALALRSDLRSPLPKRTPVDQETSMMAECMDMVRGELIEAGIIDKSVPPMMVANAVCAHIANSEASASNAASPDDLRAAGLMVAVHNDYRLHGQPHTFWLFTDSTGMSFKGEGRTDAEALEQVRALRSQPEQKRPAQ